MPATLPGGQNTFVPDHASTKQLRIEFVRNPNTFALNKWIQITPVTKTNGLYLEVTAEEASRITGDGSEFLWPDGNDMPTGTDGTESFNFKAYRCDRFAPSARLGHMATEQASWEIRAQHAKIKAQQAMTLRSKRCIAEVTNASNYAAPNTSAVASISGNTGNMAASTTARGDIKRSLNYGMLQILKATQGMVRPGDIQFVISPDGAAALSQSQEIIDHIKGAPDALAQIRGEMKMSNPNNFYYGLPDMLYGFPVVVEDAVVTTSKKGATRASSFLWPSGYCALISRPGGLEGQEGAPSFSTCTLFVYSKDDMTVEYREDQDARRTVIRVVDTNDAVLTASASGFLFTSAF